MDATDNVATRYLLNDACVLAGKPLVSGSALRMDGQVHIKKETENINKQTKLLNMNVHTYIIYIY